MKNVTAIDFNFEEVFSNDDAIKVEFGFDRIEKSMMLRGMSVRSILQYTDATAHLRKKRDDELMTQ